jgi:hypothetical protein
VSNVPPPLRLGPTCAEPFGDRSSGAADRERTVRRNLQPVPALTVATASPRWTFSDRFLAKAKIRSVIAGPTTPQNAEPATVTLHVRKMQG